MSRETPCAPARGSRARGRRSNCPVEQTMMEFTQANPYFSRGPPADTSCRQPLSTLRAPRPVAASSPTSPCPSGSRNVSSMRSPDMSMAGRSRYRDIPNVRASDVACPPTAARRRRPPPMNQRQLEQTISRAGANMRLAFSMLGDILEDMPPPPPSRPRPQRQRMFEPGNEDKENVGARPMRPMVEMEERSQPMMSRRQMLESYDESSRQCPVTPGGRVIPRSPRVKPSERPAIQVYSDYDHPQRARRRALDFSSCVPTPESCDEICQSETDEDMEDDCLDDSPLMPYPPPRRPPLNFAIYQDEDDECG